MKRNRSWLRVGRSAAAVLAMTLAGPAAATHHVIDVGGSGFAFAPAVLTVAVGDTVTFVNRGGFHNVSADDGSFRCAQGCDGNGGDGNPSDAAWSADVAFTAPGTVGYHCEVHGAPGQGMYGSISVVAPPPPPSASSGIDSVPDLGAFALLALVLALAAIAVRRAPPRRLP